MRIQLKQNEIEAAIKSYIAQQGIVVGGKSVEMLFTSGRKNNGLSVEVVIEDQKVEASMATVEAQEATDDYDNPEKTSETQVMVPSEEVGTYVEPTEVKPAGSLFG